MALITVEGVYENGKVELAEQPEGVERANVMVTFLTKSKKPAAKTSVSHMRSEVKPASGDRYSQALRDEYKALIRKKLDRTLTAEEADRLEAVRADINRRDSQSESWSAWEQRAAEMDGELDDLRIELEALPDA